MRKRAQIELLQDVLGEVWLHSKRLDILRALTRRMSPTEREVFADAVDAWSWRQGGEADPDWHPPMQRWWRDDPDLAETARAIRREEQR